MKAWVRSSLVVSGVRQVFHGSVLVHGTVAAARLVTSERAVFPAASSESSLVMTRLVRRIWRSGPGRVGTLVDGSRLLRTIERFFERAAVAWHDSAITVGLGTLLNTAFSLDVHRVRLMGWIAFMAATTHIVLVGIDALVAHTAAGLGWVAALPFALACMSRPEAVLAAWHNRRFSGLLTRGDRPRSSTP